MPIQNIINHSLQLNLTIGDGKITLDELSESAKDLVSRPDFDSSYDGLCYFASNSETDILSAQMQTISSMFPRAQITFNPLELPKLAIVVSQSFFHDILHAYQSTRSDVDIKLFSTLEEASIWLERELLTSDFIF